MGRVQVGGGAESLFFVDEAFSVIVFLWVLRKEAPGTVAPGPGEAENGATQNSHSTISFKVM